MAYANEHGMADPVYLRLTAPPHLKGAQYPAQPQDRYIVEQGLSSLYDRHTDGSGVCYSSRLRPILNMRPKYYMSLLGGYPHQFNADLHCWTGWRRRVTSTTSSQTKTSIGKVGSCLLLTE